MEDFPYLLVGLALIFGMLKYIWHDKSCPGKTDAPGRSGLKTRLTALYYRNGDFAGWFDLTKKK